ncbi:MAG: TOBE domain-containing protein, partial [Streptosporangiaceae bacterium]
AEPEVLYSRPVDADLATFIGDANLLDGTLAADAVDTILGRLPLPPDTSPDGPATVLVRPEQIELHEDADGAVDGPRGRIVSYGYHGHDAVVRVQPDDGDDGQTILVRVIGRQHLPVNCQVKLRARGPVLAWPKA